MFKVIFTGPAKKRKQFMQISTEGNAPPMPVCNCSTPQSKNVG